MPTHLHVITGPMFSGKSEALIAELNRARYAKKTVAIIKPHVDTRALESIASRKIESGTSVVRESQTAKSLSSLPALQSFLAETNFDVLGVDEAQFFPVDADPHGLGWFGKELLKFLSMNRASDTRIIVAGLDQDFRGLPFGPIPGLMAIADRVDKLSGVCMSCGSYEARHTRRVNQTASTIAVGDVESYEVVCRACFTPSQ